MPSFRSAPVTYTLAVLALALAPLACGGDSDDSGPGAGGDDSSSGGTTSTGGTTATGGTTGATGGATSGAGGTAGGTGPCYDEACVGTCEGTCEDGFVCNTDAVVCARDIATFCGCDGVEFQASSTCPNQAYASEGACPAGSTGGSINGGLNCSEAATTCDSPPDACPTGQVREVVDGCWGDCVAIGACGCESHDDCPDPQEIDEFACINSTKRCDYQH